MGVCRAVKLDHQEEQRWAVINKSDWMLGPTFTEQLPALMFAGIYSAMNWTQPHRWNDEAQDLIAREIKAFIDEKMPEGERNRRYLPIEWMKEIFEAKHGDEDDAETKAEFAKGFRYDYDDLTEDADEQWKRGRAKVLDMVIEWFHKWQAEKAQARKGKV